MGDSISKRKRTFAELAGPLAVTRVNANERGLLYFVSCSECVTPDQKHPWSTYRRGRGQTYREVAYRWVLHLHRIHPQATAPCLALLEDAKAWKAERDAHVAEGFREANEALASLDRLYGTSRASIEHH